MKTINRKVVLGAGLLSLSAALATSSFAAPRDNNVRSERRDVERAKREVLGEKRDVRKADNPRERRQEEKELRDAQRDLRREKGDLRDARRDNDRDNRWHDRDHDRDHDHDGRHDRDDHHWNDRDHHWNNRPYGNDHGRPGYNNGYGRPGYNGGYNNGYGRPGYNGGYNQNYSYGQRIEFPGYVVDDVNGGGTFRVRGDNGITYNVRPNERVRLRRGQRVRVSGDWRNGVVDNAGVNFI